VGLAPTLTCDDLQNVERNFDSLSLKMVMLIPVLNRGRPLSDPPPPGAPSVQTGGLSMQLHLGVSQQAKGKASRLTLRDGWSIESAFTFRRQGTAPEGRGHDGEKRGWPPMALQMPHAPLRRERCRDRRRGGFSVSGAERMRQWGLEKPWKTYIRFIVAPPAKWPFFNDFCAPSRGTIHVVAWAGRRVAGVHRTGSDRLR